jgi:hypothetical protein
VLPVPRHRPCDPRRQVGRRGEVKQARGLGDVVHTTVRQEVEPAARQRNALLQAGRQPVTEPGYRPDDSRVPPARAIAAARSLTGTGSDPARWKHSPMAALARPQRASASVMSSM